MDVAVESLSSFKSDCSDTETALSAYSFGPHQPLERLFASGPKVAGCYMYSYVFTG